MRRLGLAALFAALPALGGTIKLFTGETLSGEIEFGDSLSVRTEAGPTVKVDPAIIQRATLRESKDGYAPGMVLRNGARMKAGAPAAPQSEVAWIVYRPVTAQEANAVPPGRTGALLPGGDFFEGTIRSADQTAAKVVSPIFGARSFDGARGDILAAIVAPVKPAPAAFEILNTAGEIFLGDQLSFTAAGATLTVAGKTQTIPVVELAEIRTGPGRAMPLAITRMARAEVARGLPAARAMTIDATPDGGALQVGSEKYEHGLASYSGCAGTWEVPANFSEFIGRFGVAPATPPNVRLTFTVVADGRSIFRSQPMTSADSPQTIRASLGNARTVTLRVETQFPSGAIGLGIWIEPTLLRR
jgi:hypothetical protein